jgi:ABC-type multidrug transport system fused ATPase/permease subunit
VRGEIRFENVSFAYVKGRKQLYDISLTIPQGEMIALVGPSGAGKSTLIQLIPRFYDPQKGRITLDGFDIRDLQLRSLRSQIGTVAQETILFSGTIEENLLYGKPNASESEMIAAAEAAHAHQFITGLENGYQTVLGERGAKLSGGQKQRLALARAFLCDPRILILDEATSALDSESEALIQDALDRLMKNRTSIVIAHRLSTIVNADRIVVMSDGRIRELGPHAELLEKNGIYTKLYETQFGSIED